MGAKAKLGVAGVLVLVCALLIWRVADSSSGDAGADARTERARSATSAAGTAPDEVADAVGATVERSAEAEPMGMENGAPIEGSLDNVGYFRKRGIRYITLAHSKSNHISDSSYDSNERWGGLSEFGKKLVPAMNDEGIMVDISHLSDAAAWIIISNEINVLN